jgi:hypothetical protein
VTGCGYLIVNPCIVGPKKKQSPRRRGKFCVTGCGFSTRPPKTESHKWISKASQDVVKRHLNSIGRCAMRRGFSEPAWACAGSGCRYVSTAELSLLLLRNTGNELPVPPMEASYWCATPVVWTFFHRFAQARLSRRLEPVVGDPSAPGSYRCRGRNRNRNRFRRCIDSAGVLWLVLPHGVASLPSFVSIATMRSNKALRVAFPFGESAVSKSHLLSFDSDSDTDPDTDPDPDYNPCRDRDALSCGLPWGCSPHRPGEGEDELRPMCFNLP